MSRTISNQSWWANSTRSTNTIFCSGRAKMSLNDVVRPPRCSRSVSNIHSLTTVCCCLFICIHFRIKHVLFEKDDNRLFFFMWYRKRPNIHALEVFSTKTGLSVVSLEYTYSSLIGVHLSTYITHFNLKSTLIDNLPQLMKKLLEVGILFHRIALIIFFWKSLGFRRADLINSLFCLLINKLPYLFDLPSSIWASSRSFQLVKCMGNLHKHLL